MCRRSTKTTFIWLSASICSCHTGSDSAAKREKTAHFSRQTNSPICTDTVICPSIFNQTLLGFGLELSHGVCVTQQKWFSAVKAFVVCFLFVLCLHVNQQHKLNNELHTIQLSFTGSRSGKFLSYEPAFWPGLVIQILYEVPHGANTIKGYYFYPCHHQSTENPVNSCCCFTSN